MICTDSKHESNFVRYEVCSALAEVYLQIYLDVALRHSH